MNFKHTELTQCSTTECNHCKDLNSKIPHFWYWGLEDERTFICNDCLFDLDVEEWERQSLWRKNERQEEILSRMTVWEREPM